MRNRVQVKYSWRGRRWMWALFIYWLALTGGAAALAGAGAGEARSESGWPILCFIVFVVVCMSSAREGWGVAKRVGVVIASWCCLLFLSAPAAFIVFALGGLKYIDRGATLLASIPILLIVMRRSRHFSEKATDGTNAPMTSDTFEQRLRDSGRPGIMNPNRALN